MSQLEFQKIAHILTGAANADTVDGRTYVLYTEDSSLISKEWTGKTFTNQTEVVEDGVRPGSTAAYVRGKSIETVIYMDSSSMLHIIDFDEESDEWYEDPKKVIQHKAHPSSHIAACLNGLGHIVVVYHTGRHLVVFALASPTHTTNVPVKCSPDTALYALFVDGVIRIFYISADGCLHYATKSNELDWSDTKWSTQPFNGTVKRFIVNATREGTTTRFEAHVLTDRAKILQVSANGHCSNLGRVDENGTFVSERAVDMCCIEAQENTLTEKRLHDLLAEDPAIINAFGGPLSITPLAAACWSGSVDAVDLLLDNPIRLADPNALSPKNRTPLYYAVRGSIPENRRAIVRALLDAGAKVDACYPEDQNNTPLMTAIADTADKEVIHELVDRGASLTKTNMQGQTAVVLAEGTGLEQELMRSEERELKKAGPHSIQKELVQVLVAIAMLIIAYFNNDVVKDIVEGVLVKCQEALGDDLEEEDDSKDSD
ncbi:hypothetical protein D9613_013015 [Agrocybe pediades]|uniref:Uncharacterized protein n=1 Tax=Agrocybe pediades TaxID=84607 RepID=A0A8H4QUZ8_9AGAR|nr:hypothetical protein D9613_013015 [Agrocybe pediades]